MKEKQSKKHFWHMDRQMIVKIISIAVCGAMLTGFPVAASSDKVALAQHPHQMSDVIVSQEPACETVGKGFSKCLFEGCDYTEDVELPALEHQMEDVCCVLCYNYFDSEYEGLYQTEEDLVLVKDGKVQRDYTDYYYSEDGQLLYVKEGIAYDHYCGDVEFTWPTPACDLITSYFGRRSAPTAGASTDHNGIDIGAMSGTVIVAVADGKVTEAGYNQWNGNYVCISHGDGLKSVYAHCKDLCVESGQEVQMGDEIATVGSTGISTGAHLHFTIYRDGVAENPLFYISN